MNLREHFLSDAADKEAVGIVIYGDDAVVIGPHSLCPDFPWAFEGWTVGWGPCRGLFRCTCGKHWLPASKLEEMSFMNFKIADWPSEEACLDATFAFFEARIAGIGELG